MSNTGTIALLGGRMLMDPQPAFTATWCGPQFTASTLVSCEMHLNVYTAPAGTPAADALAVLASWAASQEALPTERSLPPG